MHINLMKIEWYEPKRQKTLKERNLDFADVDRFDWTTAMVAEDVRKNYGELRSVAFGMLDARLVCLVYTLRGEALRVISLRKANEREEKVYDSFKARITD